MGIFLALACGFTWSCTVILFKKCEGEVHPLALNLFKNTIGFLLMIPTLFVFESFPLALPNRSDLMIILLSGMLGIGIADWLFLTGLRMLGATRTAIIDCLYAPFIIVLSHFLLGEKLNTWEMVGVVLILSAIFLVTKFNDETPLRKKQLLLGTLLGCIAIMCMASGILMIKPLFSSVSLFLIIILRLMSGLFVSMVSCAMHPNRRGFIAQLLNARQKHLLFLAAFLGTYVSMMFWVSGFKYEQASVASVLNQTSTIFTVLFAIIFLGEAFSKRVLLATVLALCGVILISVQ